MWKADLDIYLLLLLYLCRDRCKGVVDKSGQAAVGWDTTVGQTIVGQPMEAKGRNGEVCSIVWKVVGGVAVRAVGQTVVAGKV